MSSFAKRSERHAVGRDEKKSRRRGCMCMGRVAQLHMHASHRERRAVVLAAVEDYSSSSFGNATANEPRRRTRGSS